MTPTSTVRRVVSTRMPTRWAAFRDLGIRARDSQRQPPGRNRTRDDPRRSDGGRSLVRIHSQCFTGEVLGSLRCDCNDQLEIAMRAIADEGRGLVIYEHQEGRGIGLMAKLQAYALQDSGLDTVDANHALGFPADCRDFSLPAAILHELRVSRVRLLSNNPHKSRGAVGRRYRGRGADSLRSRPDPTFLALPACQEGEDGARSEPGSA